MKKFFYTLLFLAVALASTTAFISCSKDSEDEPKNPATLSFQYWLSEDLLKIVDVKTTGIPPLSFTTKSQRELILITGKKVFDGYESQTVKLQGQQADDAKFSVELTLKPNWKEIIGDQKEVVCQIHYLLDVKRSDGSTTYDYNGPTGSTFNVDTEEARLVDFLKRKAFSYPSAD